jgi:hypothetical protein
MKIIERGFSLIKRKITDGTFRFGIKEKGFFPDKSGRIKMQMSENHIAESDIEIFFLSALSAKIRVPFLFFIV